MPVLNQDIAQVFQEIADMEEILGANPFRVRAYRNAARTLQNLGRELHRLVDEGADLTELEGIGKDLSEKIEELVKTGHSEHHTELLGQVPPGLLDVLHVPGLGPKKVKALWEELGITGTDDLRAAAQANQIRELEGFGQKTEANILAALERELDREKRFLRARAAPYAEVLRDHLAPMAEVERVEIAGSYRRGKETVGDLDLLVAADAGWDAIMDAFTGHEMVSDVIAHGETKASVRLRNGIQMDLRIVEPASYGAALVYFTGSKEHNVRLRGMAKERGLKVNEYAVSKGDEPVAGASEEAVYACFDLPVIPPWLREDRGEFDAAAAGTLPAPLEEAAYRGNLHAHTDWSDGQHTLAEIAEAAAARGYAYWAVTDHSRRLTVANGLDEKRLRKQIDEIKALNQQLGGKIRVLSGIEVDILEDGSLDLPDSVLKELDVVVLAVHSRFGLPEEQQTARILKAMDNPYATFVAHPTGRLLTARAGYAVDVVRMVEHAAERGIWLEINCHPQRLDLDDVHARWAKEAGVPVTINTDAHTIRDMDNLAHGLMQARRAWLEPRDVVNCLELEPLLAAIAATKLA